MASDGSAASASAGFGCRILRSAVQPLPRMHEILLQRIHFNSVIHGFSYLSTHAVWFHVDDQRLNRWFAYMV